MLRMKRWKLMLAGFIPFIAGCGGGGGGAASAAPSTPAAATVPAVVSSSSTTQPWHIGLWSPATLAVQVKQGQSLLVITGQWNANATYSTVDAPSMSPGSLTAVVDPAPGVVGQLSPPVYAQVYAAFDLPAGTYTITPPDEGGTSGDGTMYVAVVSGIGGVRSGSSANVRLQGTALPGVSVTAGATTQPGDLLLAAAVYDDNGYLGSAGMTDPPSGWTSIGANQDAPLFPPMEASWKAAAGGAESVGWSWVDNTVNVAHALVAAFVPKP